MFVVFSVVVCADNLSVVFFLFFFFNDTATTEIYTDWHTLSLHDALPISLPYVIRMSGLLYLACALALGGMFVAYAWRLYRQYSRSEEHTSELQSLMRISYAVFCLKKKNLLRYT